MTVRKTSAPITSDQRGQLRDFVVKAIFKAIKQIGLDRDGFQRLLSRGGEFLEYVKEGIRRFSAALPDYGVARAILGDDFISPEEVAKARGLKYSPKQLRQLAESLPRESVLKELKRDGYALVPRPPKVLSLLEIRDLKTAIFYTPTGGWYSDPREKFATADKTVFGWLAIKKTMVAGSTSKTWNEQNPLLPESDRVPNAAEFAWFLTTYLEVRKNRLFQGLYARTSSVDADGGHVGLGFDGESLYVRSCWDGYPYSNLGLASARLLAKA